jgi:hypothetical protein
MNKSNNLTKLSIGEAPSFEKLSMASFGLAGTTTIDLDDDLDVGLDPSFVELLPDELRSSLMISSDFLRASSEFLRTSVCYDSPRINFRSPSPIVMESKAFAWATTHGAGPKKPPPINKAKAISKKSMGLIKTIKKIKTIKTEDDSMTYKDILQRRARQPWNNKVRTLTKLDGSTDSYTRLTVSFLYLHRRTTSS